MALQVATDPNLRTLVSNLFPKAEEREYLDRFPEKVLPCLVAQDKPISEMAPYVQLGPKYTRARSLNQLSALDVCAIMGNEAAAELILSKGIIPLFDPDKMGRTPIHYAYLMKDVHPKIWTLFRSRVVVCCFGDEQKTEAKLQAILRGEDPRFLNVIKLIQPVFPDDSKIVFSYRNSSSGIREGTAQEFKEMTGARYYDGVYAKPLTLVADWVESRAPDINYLILEAPLLAGFTRYKEKPPRLYLQPCEGAGYEVRTQDPISEGEVLCVYAGEQGCSSTLSADDRYIMVRTTGRSVRNIASMVNHSFPNALFLPIYDKFGVSQAEVLVASDIEAGGVICYDYGTDYGVEGFIEFRQGALEAFIKKIGNPDQYAASMKSVATLLDEINAVYKKLFRYAIEEKRLGYVFRYDHAFSTLLNLHRGDSRYLNRLANHLETDVAFQEYLGLETDLQARRIAQCKAAAAK